MTKASLIFIVSLGLIVACARDDVAGPQASVPTNRVFTRLEITPGNIVLLPDSTSQLTIKALDQFGAQMLAAVDGNGNTDWAAKASYWNEDPQIVEVNSRGLVKGIAPGKARITALLTIGGETREVSTSVTVSGPSGFSAGVYDLTAWVTDFDPAWGDITGYRYTAVLTFPSSGIGTVQDFRLIDSTGNVFASIGGGVVNSSMDFAGRIVDEVATSNFHFSLVAPVQDLVDPRLVTGTFGCCGHIGGTFTAKRRQ